MSTKKELREAKALKKAAKQRTQAERQQELDTVFSKFVELGISEDMDDALKTFFHIARTFIDDGVSCSGRIKITAINREINYILSNNKLNQIQVLLRAIY